MKKPILQAVKELAIEFAVSVIEDNGPRPSVRVSAIRTVQGRIELRWLLGDIAPLKIILADMFALANNA